MNQMKLNLLEDCFILDLIDCDTANPEVLFITGNHVGSTYLEHCFQQITLPFHDNHLVHEDTPLQKPFPLASPQYRIYKLHQLPRPKTFNVLNRYYRHIESKYAQADMVFILNRKNIFHNAISRMSANQNMKFSEWYIYSIYFAKFFDSWLSTFVDPLKKSVHIIYFEDLPEGVSIIRKNMPEVFHYTPVKWTARKWTLHSQYQEFVEIKKQVESEINRSVYPHTLESLLRECVFFDYRI